MNSGSSARSARLTEKRAIDLLHSDPEEAERLIAGLLTLTPDRLQLLRPYARLLMRKGQFDAALPCWQRIRAAVPHDAEPKMAIARIHLRASRLLEAAESAREILAEDSTHGEARAISFRIAERASEKFAAGGVGHSVLPQQLIEVLNSNIPGSRHLDMLKSFASDGPFQKGMSAEKVPIHPAALAVDADSEVAELIDELAAAGHWLSFLDVLEEVLPGRDDSPAVIGRHREALLKLARCAEQTLASRADRLLYFASERPFEKELFAGKVPTRPAAIALDADSEVAERIDELAAAGRWLPFLDLLEEVLSGRDDSPAVISRHREALLKLARGAEQTLASRADRLLRFATERPFEKELFAKKVPTRPAAIALDADSEVAERIDELAAAGRWLPFLDLLEEVLSGRDDSPAVISRHREALLKLARGAEQTLASRADRLLRLATERPFEKELFAKKVPTRPAAIALDENLEVAERIDELAAAGRWLPFLDLLEEVLSGRDDSPAVIGRHREALLKLARGAEQTLASRADRLLRFATSAKEQSPPSPSGARIARSAATDRHDFMIAPLGGKRAYSEENARLARLDPSMAIRLASFHVSQGQIEKAIQVYHEVGFAQPDFWTEAAKLAALHNRKESLSEFLDRAFSCSIDKMRVATRLSKTFLELGDADTAILVWRKCRAHSDALRIWLMTIQLQYRLGRDEELFAEFQELVSTREGLVDRFRDDPLCLIEIVRRVRASAIRSRMGAELDKLATTIEEQDTPSALRSWTLGSLASAKPDFEKTLAHFECGAANQSELQVVNFQAEIAMLHARFHDFGRAKSAIADASANGALSAEQRAQFQRVNDVVEFCGTKGELLYPECLIDTIFEELDRASSEYEPFPASLMTIAGSLDQGGGERQTVTVLSEMAKNERVSRHTLAVRSLESTNESFFLPVVQQMSIEVLPYGRNWRSRSNIEMGTPASRGSARLAKAIDLLPHNLREDVIRLCKLIAAHRPQAVHVRQDLYGAALACAVAGVPMTVVHRGSLSPDLWGYSDLQTQQHLRPMRHVYRKLLGRGGFAIINNSGPGSRSDREWTQWADEAPFAVVHNTYDFGHMGTVVSRNEELRQQLGIQPDQIVIGTAFRFVPVKRPMLWIEAAALVNEVIPDAHFLIVGDGPLLSDVGAFAAARGFADRVHLPGRMSDMGEWYRCMDLNLLTSEREGLPNVLIEGQHFGVPAIAADVGGAKETIDVGRTGYLVEPGSGPEGFANVILNALRDPVWLAAARAYAPDFVHRKFSAERTVDRILATLGIV